MDWDGLADTIRKELNAKDEAREKALVATRATIRAASVAIRAIHRRDWEQADASLEESRKSVRAAEAALADYPDIKYAGFLQDAQKEYVEAETTRALVLGKKLAGPDELGVDKAPFLTGLGDTVGEIRRHILDLMREGEIESGERLFAVLDDIYYFMLSFNYPDAVTPGLRRAADIVKSIMERTRSDLAIARRDQELRDALVEFEKRLEK